MYKEVLRSIAGIEIWPIISFLIFFLFFACLLLWVAKSDKKHIDQIAHLPLEDSYADVPQKGEPSHV